MTETITAMQILDGLKSAVKRAGKDTTRTCYYVVPTEDGQAYEAHCIVGTVLADLGAPLSTLHAYEDVNAQGIRDRRPNGASEGTGPELPFTVEDAGWRLLLEAQYVQDDGAAWDRALSAAEHEARMLNVLHD